LFFRPYAQGELDDNEFREHFEQFGEIADAAVRAALISYFPALLYPGSPVSSVVSHARQIMRKS